MLIQNELDYLRLGWVQAFNIQRWEPYPELRAWCQSQAQAAASTDASPACERRRESVRALLRKGGYKPSGRNKPAQEYLMRCVREGDGLPEIVPAVDVLNALSVRFGLPISMLGRKYFENQIRLRLGRSGESYTFNSAGQTLELEKLIIVCGGEDGLDPLGSPVKDSMGGKITPEDRDVLCFLYGPSEEVTAEAMEGYAQELGMNLVEWAGAESILVGCV